MEAGHQQAVLDDLSSRHPRTLADGVIRSGREQDVADNVLPSARFDGVLHRAGSIEIVESVKKSEKYWDNNVHPTKGGPADGTASLG